MLGASFVPRIVTVTKPVPVPSLERTEKVSVSRSPSRKLLNALFAVYVQFPFSIIVNLPLVPAV